MLARLSPQVNLNHRRADRSRSMKVPIHEIFTQTIQGEGFWTGTPADFIRLFGCPVGCPWCDTGYADGGRKIQSQAVSVEEILAQIVSPLVVVTGGEPFAYSWLPDLCFLLLEKARISIETSGSFWQEIPDACWLTLSPKEHVSPQYPINENCWQRANEIKLVVADGSEVAFYLKKHPDLFSKPCFLQPEWYSRDRTIPMTLKLLREYPTARLSVQLHKLLGLP